MKLAEALILRADLQTRLEQIRDRMIANARVQEGEKPAEDPKDLLKELDGVTSQLEELIAKINLTNAMVKADGVTITELLAKRECLMQKISITRSLLDNASSLIMRGSRNEVKILSTVPVAKLRKEIDQKSEELRKLDTKIQSLNWTTDLI